MMLSANQHLPVFLQSRFCESGVPSCTHRSEQGPPEPCGTADQGCRGRSRFGIFYWLRTGTLYSHSRLIIGYRTQAAAFPIAEYSYQAVTDIFEDILGFSWPSSDKSELRVALWNVGVNIFGNFLSVTEADI